MAVFLFKLVFSTAKSCTWLGRKVTPRVTKEAVLSLTIGRLQGVVNEISCRLEVNIQIKVCRVICRNATIDKAVAVKALVPYAASLGVCSV